MTTTPKSSNPLASPHVSSHLGFQVSRLARAAGLTPADRDDLRQDLSLAVVQARRNFRPELGPPEAFDLGALNLAYCEQARAIRRRRERKPTPLSLWLSAGGPVDQRSVDPFEAVDARLDLESARARLDDDAWLTASLVACHSAAGAARALGVHRGTVGRRIQQIQALAGQAGPARNTQPPRAEKKGCGPLPPQSQIKRRSAQRGEGVQP